MHTHTVITTVTRPFAGPVSRNENPAAHGGVTVHETCADGYVRRENVNGLHVEEGSWSPGVGLLARQAAERRERAQAATRRREQTERAHLARRRAAAQAADGRWLWVGPVDAEGAVIGGRWVDWTTLRAAAAQGGDLGVVYTDLLADAEAILATA
jgi:hypothetical protein